MAKFEIGRQVVTRGVYDKGMEDPEFLKFVNASFVRFTSGDWGDLCEDDKALNEDALKDGDRLMGEYVDKERGWKIWIITEADRSVTTILFPRIEVVTLYDEQNRVDSIERKSYDLCPECMKRLLNFLNNSIEPECNNEEQKPCP